MLPAERKSQAEYLRRHPVRHDTKFNALLPVGGMVSDGMVEEKRACRKRTEVYWVLSELGMVICSFRSGNCSPAVRPATSLAPVARFGKRSESEIRRVR